MSDRDNHDFLIGLTLGTLIGAGVVYLFGTKDGERTRLSWYKKGEDTLKNLDGVLDSLEEKGEAVKKGAEKITAKIANQTKNFKKEVAADTVESLDETLASIEDLQEKGRQATSNLRKKYFLRHGKKLAHA